MTAVMSGLFFVTVFFLKARKAVSSDVGLLISAHIRDVFDHSCRHTRHPFTTHTSNSGNTMSTIAVQPYSGMSLSLVTN